MSRERLSKLVEDLGLDRYVTDARTEALLSEVSSGISISTEITDRLHLLPRLAFLHETEGLEALESSRLVGDDDSDEARRSFRNAFFCWRALAAPDGSGDTSAGFSERSVDTLAQELVADPLPARLALAFHLAVNGCLAHESAATRLSLRRFQFASLPDEAEWKDHVAYNLFAAFVLLTRKDQGWRDIDSALSAIERLRELQNEYEEQYIETLGDESDQALGALVLVGLYHLAQIVTLTGSYLRDGGATNVVRTKLDRHRERAGDALRSASSNVLAHLADLLWVGCREVIGNSIWTHVSGLGEGVQQFVQLLTSRGRPNPVLELWPSQQAALRRNLLDPYKRAVLVEMPTSAGKTLLAKFSMVQTKALNPTATILYLVPTRALVNQVTQDLRVDLSPPPLGLVVEQAVPAFELDPTEDKLLRGKTDILVSTPEKVDLLIRRDHPIVADVSLVIADEAHGIRDGARGARLELLLGTLKRERAEARFLLLSPFLPNDSELVRWLGEERALDPISVSWRPSSRVVGALTIGPSTADRSLVLETLPAAENVDLQPGITVRLARYDGRKSKKDLTRAAVKNLRDRGAVLVLCRGQGTASERASEIAGESHTRERSDRVAPVCRYIEAEAGTPLPICEYLTKGVAYHHAGLSLETRWLIEGLIRSGDVDVVCGTTTLAQGVNFPIRTVIVESLQKGRSGTLGHEDFWNIAGRAGRTLMDTVGLVAFPARDASDVDKYAEFLRADATEISSQLAALIDRADEISSSFTMSAVLRWPALGTLMQFLAHAMKVSGSDNLADEVEELLRASLVYHQARKHGPEGTRRLVRLCRAYLATISGVRGSLALADQTGFSTPSVFFLQQRLHQDPALKRLEVWSPEELFGRDLSALTERIQAIGDLPEIQLGTTTPGRFNPRRIAEILQGWVAGESLARLSESFPGQPGEKRVAEFSRYLFGNLLGKASWGLGALEALSLSGTSDADIPRNAEYVPSMLYFGVNRPEAVWLRMVGVPRLVARRLGDMWKGQVGSEPETFGTMRKWVSDLSDSDWRQAIPPDSGVDPSDMREIWRQLGSTS